MSTCSVIMVSYYTGPVLFASIKSVLRQKGLAELVVVDNGNPPSVLSRLQQMTLTEPRLVVVTGGGNVGFSKGCNNGTAHATGEFLLLLNPDCLLPPDALTQMIHEFVKYPQAMLAGCWMQNPDGSEQRGGRRHLLTPKTALAEALQLHRLSKKYERLNIHRTLMPRETHQVEAISGAFMFMRTKDFRDIGGLDEGYFLHVEDLDLCMRIHKAGGKILCVPSVQVTHVLSTSMQISSRFIEWHKTKGFLRYFPKHFRERMNPVSLWVVSAAIMARFVVKIILSGVRSRLSLENQISNSRAAKRLMVLASGLADLPEKKDWYGKTVLVTGATGQVGLCVMKRLIASGAAVLALSRNDPIPFRHEHLRWIKGDIADRSFNLQDYIVDAVVHCAPLWHLPPIIDMLADAEVKRIIAFGSTSVFGKATSKNPYEIDLVDKFSKAEMEIAMRSEMRGIQWTIFRPTLIYGVGLDKNITVLAKFIDRFGVFPVYPPAFGRRQPVHADDLAIAVLQAAATSLTVRKTYNVSGGSILTYREMVEDIFTACQRTPRIINTTLLPFLFDVAGKLFRKKDINGEVARRMNEDLVFFHDEATKDFGFNPRTFLSSGMKDIEGF
jgi:GT2 family glycosyltransferase/nucleoside-diphosphate-sugar epimerase